VGKGIATSISEQLGGPMVEVMNGRHVMEEMESAGFLGEVQPSRASMIRIAQQMSADEAVMGTFEGTETDVRISVRIFDLEKLKLSGRISANGPLSALPQMENELAWQILANIGVQKVPSREEYQQRTRRIPNSAFESYIRSFEASGENEQRRLLIKAVEAYGNFPEAQLRLGSLYYAKSDCNNALLHLKKAVDETADHAESDFMIATCYLQTGRPLLAIEPYSRVLKDSRPFEVLNNLGVAYLRRGQNALALNVLDEANKQASLNSTISLNLAIAQLVSGDTSLAVTTVEEAVKANPADEMLQFLLGFLFKSQGEEKKAEPALQRAAGRGIPTEKLLAANPSSWTRVFSDWSDSEKQSAVSSPQPAVKPK